MAVPCHSLLQPTKFFSNFCETFWLHTSHVVQNLPSSFNSLVAYRSSLAILKQDNIWLQCQNIFPLNFTWIFISSLFLVFIYIKYLKTAIMLLLTRHLVNLQYTYFAPLIFLHKSMSPYLLITHVSPLWTPSNIKTFSLFLHNLCF